MRRQKLFVVVVLLVLYFHWVATSVHAQQVTFVDITGGTSYTAGGESGVIYAFPILISSPGLVWAIGVNWAGTVLGSVRVALYTNNGTGGPDRPSSFLTDSATNYVATSSGWQDIPVALRSVTFGNYWVAIQVSAGESVFAIASTSYYYYRGFGSFNSSWPVSNSTLDNQVEWNMRVISLPPISASIAPHLEQQNQVNALPASLHAGSYWEWIRTQVLFSMREMVRWHQDVP